MKEFRQLEPGDTLRTTANFRGKIPKGEIVTVTDNSSYVYFVWKDQNWNMSRSDYSYFDYVGSGADTISKAKALLAHHGYFVRHLLSKADVVGRMEYFGVTPTDELVDCIMDSIGRHFDWEVGINWDVIDASIQLNTA